MSSLIKYEFRKSLKPYTIGLSIVLVLYIYLLSRIHFIQLDSETYNKFENILTVLPMTTYMGILGVGSIILVITSIFSLYEDLYKDRAYLLLSIPKTGYEIIGSKIIVSFIKMALWIFVMIVTGTHIVSSGVSKAGLDFDIIGFILDNISMASIIFISILAVFIYFLILIYFTLAFNKSILSDVKFNVVISIVLFFILGNIIGKITDLLSSAGNIFINIPINTEKIQGLINMNNVQIHPPIPSNFDLDILPVIIEIIIYTILFMVTSGLVEKKINL